MENISKITNIPLLTKDKFFDAVNKFKSHQDYSKNDKSEGNN